VGAAALAHQRPTRAAVVSTHGILREGGKSRIPVKIAAALRTELKRVMRSPGHRRARDNGSLI
jgi:hypothetical protein